MTIFSLIVAGIFIKTIRLLKSALASARHEGSMNQKVLIFNLMCFILIAVFNLLLFLVGVISNTTGTNPYVLFFEFFFITMIYFLYFSVQVMFLHIIGNFDLYITMRAQVLMDGSVEIIGIGRSGTEQFRYYLGEEKKEAARLSREIRPKA